MRKIKFRAWNKMVHRFQYFELQEIEKQKGSIQWDIIDIQQYTGLKDKNGKEIYEGDIIKINDPFSYEELLDFVFEVEFVDGSFWDWNDSIMPEKSEVIGNKYETPELLGESK